MPDSPKELTQAIDIIISNLKKYDKERRISYKVRKPV